MFGITSQSLVNRMNDGLSNMQNSLKNAEGRLSNLQEQQKQAQLQQASAAPQTMPQNNVLRPINPADFQVLDTISNSYGGSGTIVKNDNALKGLVSPLDKISVSSPFATRDAAGYGYNMSNSGKGQWNVGIDLNANIGTPLRSMGNGKVIEANQEKDGNKKIVIQFSNGVYMQPNHLDSFNVKAGDTVKAGQVIARTGNSGGTTGPHADVMLYTKDKNGKNQFIDSTILFNSFAK